MSLPYEITPEAKADLLEIWDYSCDMWGEDQADNYHQGLEEDFEALAGGQKKGKPGERLALGSQPDLRYYLSGKHYIIYRVEGEKLIVLSLIHGSSYERLTSYLKGR
jgi:toxin ParE1/3/4